LSTQEEENKNRLKKTADSSSSMSSYYIGVDVGTGSVRAALVSEAGSVLKKATLPIKIHNPKQGTVADPIKLILLLPPFEIFVVKLACLLHLKKIIDSKMT